jgi:hypothetical protein
MLDVGARHIIVIRATTALKPWTVIIVILDCQICGRGFRHYAHGRSIGSASRSHTHSYVDPRRGCILKWLVECILCWACVRVRPVSANEWRGGWDLNNMSRCLGRARSWRRRIRSINDLGRLRLVLSARSGGNIIAEELVAAVVFRIVPAGVLGRVGS